MSQAIALSRYGSDLAQAGQNLLAQKTRSILTALGIIFGVGAVIAMLAIGAGARAESLRFIEELGVRNLLVESRPAASDQELSQRRRSSPGLTERDVRILEGNVDSLETLSPRKGLHPAAVLPKPSKEMPELYGVRPSYALIHNWRLAEGRAFTPQDDEASAAVCVLGEGAKVSLFGYGSALDKYVKVNDTWLRVVGSLKEQTASGSSLAQDPNQVLYTPLRTMQYRFFDVSGYLKDELDGVDVRLKTGADSVEASKVVVAILNSTHHNTPDFTVTIPGRTAGRKGALASHLHLCDGRHRRHLFTRRRHRHHEHCARHCPRTHPRNRDPPCHRSAPLRHRSTVPLRIHFDFRQWRRPRNRLRLLSCLAHSRFRRLEHHRHTRLHHHRVRSVGHRWFSVWHLPGAKGVQNRSD